MLLHDVSESVIDAIKLVIKFNRYYNQNYPLNKSAKWKDIAVPEMKKFYFDGTSS